MEFQLAGLKCDIEVRKRDPLLMINVLRAKRQSVGPGQLPARGGHLQHRSGLQRLGLRPVGQHAVLQ